MVIDDNLYYDKEEKFGKSVLFCEFWFLIILRFCHFEKKYYVKSLCLITFL